LRGEHYGKLGVAKLPSEVKAIWYTRNVEPELAWICENWTPG